MAGYRNPRGKIVRRLKINLFGNPKYDNLLKRKPHPPGKAPKERGRGKMSDYGRQLMEKQKIMFCYGLSARQFRTLFFKAKKLPGITSSNLLSLLERRLDSVAFSSGFARSRAQARQLVSHGHLRVNGRKVDIPSYTVVAGDTIQVKPTSRSEAMVRKNLSGKGGPVSTWLQVDQDNLQLAVKNNPGEADVPRIADTQLVVEFFSR